MMDMLTQVTIMDFVGKLSTSLHGARLMNEANFLEELFNNFGGQNEDSFSFLTSNMLLVGAKMYSQDPTVFNPFENQNYMLMLRSHLCGPFDVDRPHLKDVGLSVLFFLFVQKKDSLVKYLIERPEHHEILNNFLRVAKSTNQDHRHSFLVAMRQLLKIKPLPAGPAEAPGDNT